MGMVERIKEKCKESATNISNLERELGFGNGNIRRWETQKPSYDKVLAVANLLNVSLDWLITGKETAELSPEEQLLVEYYRNTSKSGKISSMNTVKSNSEIFPAELESSTSMNGLTGTSNL